MMKFTSLTFLTTVLLNLTLTALAQDAPTLPSAPDPIAPPSTPTTPTALTTPTNPTAPTALTTPTNPATPIDPSIPTSPTNPTIFTDPIAPTATPPSLSATLSNNTTLTSNNPNSTVGPSPTASTTAGNVTTSNILTVPLPKPTITATTTQAIAPIPTAAIAQTPDKSTVDSTAPIIQYQGIWTPAKSSCDSTVSSMKCQEPLSYLSYRFKVLNDGSVYLGSTRSPDAGLFVVALDGVQTEIDGFSATADNNCSFTWSQSNLSPGDHNLTVSYVGPSPQSQTQSGSFELNNFQLVGQDTSPPAAVQSGSTGMSIHGGISSSAVTVFFAGLLQMGLLLA